MSTVKVTIAGPSSLSSSAGANPMSTSSGGVEGLGEREARDFDSRERRLVAADQ